MLDDEEMLWKQKSRKDWLTLGDQNTSYFHSQVNMRRRVNHIKFLKLDDGSWCYDEDRIKVEVVSFFKSYTLMMGQFLGDFLYEMHFQLLTRDGFSIWGRIYLSKRCMTCFLRWLP